MRSTRSTVEVKINPDTGKRFTKAELIGKILRNRRPEDLVWRQYLRYTASDLQAQLDRRESFRYTQRVETGSIHTHDYQADIYGGQFEVIDFDAKTGTYTARVLAPSADVIGRILADVEAGSYYVGAGEDRWEQAEQEIQRREARAGQTYPVKFVSAATYAEAF